MSTFPAKILVATDGSEDAVLAVQAAVDLSNETGAELHVVHVGESLPTYPLRLLVLPRPSHRGRRSARWPRGCSTRRSNRARIWGAK